MLLNFKAGQKCWNFKCHTRNCTAPFQPPSVKRGQICATLLSVTICWAVSVLLTFTSSHKYIETLCCDWCLGTLPPQLVRLSGLTHLHVINNNLTGDVTFINNLPLQLCYLSGNASMPDRKYWLVLIFFVEFFLKKNCFLSFFLKSLSKKWFRVYGPNVMPVCLQYWHRFVVFIFICLIGFKLHSPTKTASKHSSFDCELCANGLDSECDDANGRFVLLNWILDLYFFKKNYF